MNRRAAPSPEPLPGLQLSWHEGEVVAWQPGRSVYGGNLNDTVARTFRRSMSPEAANMRVVRLHLPDGQQSVMCQRLDARSTASLAELDTFSGPAGSTFSPSVTWFGAMFAFADQLVRAGRVTPTLRQTGTNSWLATWSPLPIDVIGVLDSLLATMPPAVAAPNPSQRDLVPGDVVAAFADHIARSRLASRGWAADVADTRRTTSRAVRLVGRALIAPSGAFRADSELDEALTRLATTMTDVRKRAGGEPVLRARVRLGLPGSRDVDDDADPDESVWPLNLELVDVDDRSRWCSVTDVFSRSEAAVLLARDPLFVPRLQDTFTIAQHELHELAPFLGEWLDACEGHVDLDAAALLLERVDELDTVGIEVVVPEGLARRKPTSRGVAQPADDRPGKFSAQAIIQWDAVIDDVPVDEVVLQRAAEAGSALIEVGGRWVHLDRRDARRALANLAEHRADHGELGTLQLLRLAAQLEAEAVAAAALEGGTDNAVAALVAAADGARLDADGWLGELLQGLPDTTLTEADPPPGFTATLRPYQRRGLGWLQFLHRTGFGGCLADDMGLGKTPTTLAHLAGLPGPHLVICPLSVVHNWEAEAARFVPLVRVVVHHGGGRHGAESFAAMAAANDIVISTYQVVTRDIDHVAEVRWSTVVLDEAQAIKNPDTRSAKAMRKLQAGQRLALTGTPVENRLSELWSIMSFAVPGLLGTLPQFRSQFSSAIERNHDEAAAVALRRLTSPFLLRRTKADRSLVPDLPDKVEQVAWATLTKEQASMYQAVVEQMLVDAQQESGMRRRGLVLAAITRLKQICNHPAHALGDGSRIAGRSGKLARFDELVADLLDAGEQALVFTQFREMGLLLQRHLHDVQGLEVPFLHGGVSKLGRQKMVTSFQSGGDAASPLLLVSLKAGGTGLNLTAASRVVHYDRWWNPAVEDQATDRAWRIGQQRSVFVHKLVCQGTIEEKVDQLINDKRALADAVVGTTGEAWLSELSTDELRDLVVLDRSALS